MLFKRLSGMGGLRLVTWVAVMAGPQLLLCSWIFENGQLEALYTATTVHWLTVFYLVLVLTVIGYSCWYFLLARYDINQVVPFLFVEPVSAVAGGILLLGEELTSNRIFGGLAVLAGVALVTLFSQSTKTNR
jgi:O-acetylserine/cysteine efflux transporter